MSNNLQAQEQPPMAPYVADFADQTKKVLTCHNCKITFNLTISKNRNVQYCVCCGKLGEVKDA